MLRIIILNVAVISFVFINSYAQDENKYKDPNWNDPTAPNYIPGTRTDMGPKVNIPQSDHESSNFCEPSKGTKQILENAYDSRWSDDPISGVTHQWQVIQSQKLWDEECKNKKQE